MERGEPWLRLLVLKGEHVAVGPIVESTKGRFEGILLIAMVVSVQIAWGGALIYFAVHYL